MMVETLYVSVSQSQFELCRHDVSCERTFGISLTRESYSYAFLKPIIGACFAIIYIIS